MRLLLPPRRQPRSPRARPGAGDPFFPLAGNGGYEVRHYSLRLDYEPQNNALDARAVISARATQDLSRFDLDLRGLHVGRVTVDGDPAAFKRDGQELVITPAAGIRKGRAFEVAVDYDGHPNPIIDPDKSKDGWIPTDDGAFVVNEPQGSPSWYPANDTPKDKATYDFAITVPEGRTAIANGLLVGTTDNGTTTTWRWRASDPTAPYLATATNGVFETDFGTLPNGLPEYNAVDPQTRRFGTKDPNPAARLGAPGVQRAGGRPLLGPLRALPVRERRRRRGLGAERLLLARVADAADVLARPDRGHGRARDRAHVVRRLDLAGDLA